MIDKLLLKLRARDGVSGEEEDILRALVLETRAVAADVTVVHADVDLTTSIVLLEGLMCRYKDLSSGERQITQLHLPGDFVDLHSFPLKRLDHNVMALVPCTFAVVPHDRIRAVTETQPHLTRLLWFMTTLDAAMHREWELSLGRRSSQARIAHFLCELYTRFQIIGMTQGESYTLPLTQFDLAECLGLTAIHVNRTLRDLRMGRLVTFRNKTVVIENFAELARLAEYDPAYLYVEKRPR